jgi:hypothetical protein
VRPEARPERNVILRAWIRKSHIRGKYQQRLVDGSAALSKWFGAGRERRCRGSSGVVVRLDQSSPSPLP